MTEKRAASQPGRPSKGRRDPLICRVPVDLAHLVQAGAHAENMSVSDYLARLLSWTHGYPVGRLPRAVPRRRDRPSPRIDDKRWPDPDFAATLDELESVIRGSQLGLAEFAEAVGVSRGALSALLEGRFAIPADLNRRVARVGGGLRCVKHHGWVSAFECGRLVRRSVMTGNARVALGHCLQSRSDLREAFAVEPAAVAAWEARALSSGSRGWDTLLGALVEHEFLRNDRQPPVWTGSSSLSVRADWVLTRAGLSDDEVRRRSPDYLRSRRIFVAHDDLLSP